MRLQERGTARISLVSMEPQSSATDETSAAQAVAAPADGGAEEWSRLTGLLMRQAKKFHTLLPRVLAAQDSEAVHDVRVCTRRLQQLLLIAEVRGDRQKLKALRRELHRVRAAIGEWRNCDVILERVARRFRRTGDGDRRDSWTLLDGAISKRRRRQIRRAQEKLLRPELLNLRDRVGELASAQVQPGQPGVKHALHAAIAKAYGQWAEAAQPAAQNPADELIHGFRIHMKRLRYRLEMAREFGAVEAEEHLRWLRSLQDRLGRWHDRREFCRSVARTLSRQSLLMARAKAAIYLLREAQRNEQMARREAQSVMLEVLDSPARTSFDAWIDRFIRQDASAAASAPPAAGDNGPVVDD